EGKPVIVSTIAQDGTLAIAEDGITVENSSYKNSKQPDAKPRDVTNVLVAGLGNEQLVIVKLGKGIVVESLGGFDDLINFLKGYGVTNKNLLTRGGILPKITRKPDPLENTANDNWRIKYPNRQDSDSRRIRIEREAPTNKENIIKDLNALLREKHDKHPDDRNRE
ncbi:MAG TPA: hypothetical protein VF189_02950, partial [Patescibacteria group bacterium]